VPHKLKEDRDRQHAKQYLKNFYKMTLDEYDAILESQGGHCALCPKTPEEDGRRLSVDHDHACCPGRETCGKCIRGLLCYICNTNIEWYINLPHRDILDNYIERDYL